MEKGSNTNSSILWEIEKILLSLKSLNKLPKFLLMENVIAITYKTNKGQLEKFKKFLKSLNYTSYEFILNALDHNIPQNRKRFFLLSILNKNDNYSLIVKKRPLTTKPKDFINIEELEKTNRDNLYLENIKKQISNITKRERERESLSKNLQKFKCLS
ncbi:MAG: hypothetical protein E7Y34_02465 [Mycoplasma sp.]|nr:hypothetical protein [Mycoplasma sp.]